MRRIFLVSPFFSLARHRRKGDRRWYRNCTFLSRRATARCVIFSHRRRSPARKDHHAGLRRETTAGCRGILFNGCVRPISRRSFSRHSSRDPVNYPEQQIDICLAKLCRGSLDFFSSTTNLSIFMSINSLPGR